MKQWRAGWLVAAAAALLAACGSGESAAARQSAHWASVLTRGCANHVVSIEAPARIEGAKLSLPPSCTVEIVGGSLTLSDVTATVGTLAIVLSPKASLEIRDSTVTGASPEATVTITSSGNGQSVDLIGDHLTIGRGMLVEVGMGTGTTGVHDLSVTGTSVVTDQPRSLGIQFLVRGPARFTNDNFRVESAGSSVIVESATPRSCTINHVSGYKATACAGFP